MLEKLGNFCSQMDQENFQVHYEAFQLKENPSDYNKGGLKEIEIKYLIKSRGIMTYDKIKEIIKTGEPLPTF